MLRPELDCPRLLGVRNRVYRQSEFHRSKLERIICVSRIPLPHCAMVDLSRQWKWLATDDSSGIVLNQGMCEIRTKTLRNDLASFRQNGPAVFVIMGIRSQHMHRI